MSDFEDSKVESGSRRRGRRKDRSARKLVTVERWQVSLRAVRKRRGNDNDYLGMSEVRR